MPLVESLRYVVTADTAGAAGNLNRLGTAAQGSMSKLDQLKGAFGAGLGLGAGAGAVQGIVAGLEKLATVAIDQLGQAVNAASTLEQSTGAVKAIFGSAAGEVERFGRTAAESVGLSNAAAQQQAAVIGALLQNLGKTKAEAAATSQTLIQTGADLAATFGGRTADAVSAIGAALRGMRDPIERYGISIKQVAVDQEVLRLGLDTSTAALKTQAESTATLSLIQKQAASSAGAFARESGTLAGQQQRFNAELENARAELGQALLPAMTELVKVGRDVIPVVSSIASGLLAVGEAAKDAAVPVVAFVDVLGSIASSIPGDPIGKLFGGSDGGAKAKAIGELKEFAEAVFDGKVALESIAPAVAFLPPSLRALADKFLGVAPAVDSATAALADFDAVAKGLGSVGDSLFSTARKTAALFKAAAPAEATSNAKQYESALRRIEDAERSLADAQEGLNETLIQRFLIGLGASSDEITSAQIDERNSTRSLADAKLRLIDAEQALARLRGGGAAASRLEAQAAFLEAQKTLAEAQQSGDPAGLLKAKAALLRAQQGLEDTSSAKQAQDIARAEGDVEAARDGVTAAAIAQRNAQRDLNNTLIRGKEGSKELADANRQVEDAQRRLEDQTRNLDDAQDGLVDALNSVSGAGKNAEGQFYATADAADSLIQDLIKRKAGPEEFAKAVDDIATALGSVATEAGKTAELDAYIGKLKDALRLYADLGGFPSKTVSGVMPKGGLDGQGLPIGGGTSPRQVVVQISGKTLLDIVIDENSAAGSPLVSRTSR